jgi:cytochrome c556
MRHAVALAFAIPCLVLGALASSGRAADMVDTREQAFRTEAERTFVFDQMRLLLNSITEIEQGLGTNDMDLVAREAAARGRKANMTLARPPSLAAKESDAWKSMFLSVRYGFDVVADQARDHAPAATINKTLADTMRNCVACHQTYRIAVVAQ